jgi:hypothetical protein
MLAFRGVGLDVAEGVDGRSHSLAACRLTGLPPEGLLHTVWHGGTFRPAHFVAVDHRLKVRAWVLAFGWWLVGAQ